MSSAPQSRKTLNISDSLNRQLNTYAQVASAAGVSVLALAGASEAKVVYTETYQVTHTGFPLYIDLNQDGINDVLLRTTFYVGSSGLEIGLDASAYRNADNAVAGRRFSRRVPLSRRSSLRLGQTHRYAWAPSAIRRCEGHSDWICLRDRPQQAYHRRPGHWPGCDYGAPRNVRRVGARKEIASHRL